MSEDFYWQLAEDNPEAIVWDEYREAYLGVGSKNGQKPVAVYDMRVLQGLIIEDFLSRPDYMEAMYEKYDDNEEAMTKQVVKDSIKFIEDKVMNAEGSDGENAPIFLDIPYIDSRYEMMEEE
tara:strand:- start:50 stop:415 length:366 start_codon:yes stop_codon:yes gene_type:complete